MQFLFLRLVCHTHIFNPLLSDLPLTSFVNFLQGLGYRSGNCSVCSVSLSLAIPYLLVNCLNIIDKNCESLLFSFRQGRTWVFKKFNLLKPNDQYSGRTAPLTSKRCILCIYSSNMGTEYFKHGLYSPFFPSKCSLFHNSNEFGSCIFHILYTGCARIKKK